MNREELLEAMNHFEQRYPVDEWCVDQVGMWPYIRMRISIEHAKHVERFDGRSEPVKSKRLLIFRLLFSFIYFIKLLLVLRPAKFIFSSAQHFRVKYKDAAYNKYFDPMIDFLKETGVQSYLIESREVNEKHDLYNRERIIFLHPLLMLFRVGSKISRWFLGSGKKMDVKLVDYDLFLADLCSQKLEFSPGFISKDKIVQAYEALKIYDVVYTFIFNRVKPKVALGLCYYDMPIMGMNVAAKRKNVIAVDLQHGGQGPFHFAYSGWKKVPQEGFAVMPKVFWCWDKDSESLIRKWSNTSRFHKTIHGGNPWIAEFLSTDAVHKYSLPGNTITYTLQPIGPLIEDFIVRAIAKSRGRYNWFLRLHPRQMHRKAELEKLLADHSLVDNVNVTQATEWPLLAILANSMVHLSRFSGSVLEAYSLGIPTIVIDELGVKNFGMLPGELIFPFLEADENELLRLIEEIKSMAKDYSVDLNALFKQKLLEIDRLE